jgi:meiosis-specific protein HOP1
VTSITPYLPSSTDYDNEAFGGAVAHAGRMTLTPLQEVNLSKKQGEVQFEDATKRNVVWAADGDVEGDADAEAEDDPDYFRLEDGTYNPINPTPVPIGIRMQAGVIKPVPIQASVEEVQYGGASERVPTKLREMVGRGILGRVNSDHHNSF